MKLYLTFFILLAFKGYGQAISEAKFYIDNQQVSQAAKDFYYGRFKAADDTKTFSIIDSLETKNNLTRPFYIFLVSKIIDKADGALSEELGVRCKDFLESHPDFLIDFLYCKGDLCDARFFDNWANQIADEFKIYCEGKERQCIQRSLQQVLAKTRLSNKSRLRALYHKIDSYCK